jgi:hypothetical protein
MKDIVVYKTFEISDELWKTIVDGFNECFPEHKKTRKDFVERYKTNPMGYCYHALYFEDSVLAGFNSITPMVYSVDGKEVVFGQSGDTFILPQYRKDMMLFKRIYLKLKEECSKDGVIAFLGVPNPNSYLYSIKILGCKEVLHLDYWILPIKIGNIIKKFRWINYISPLYAYLNFIINYPIVQFFNQKEKITRIRVKINENFLDQRFKASHYTNIKDKNYRFTYSITHDEGVWCAYIMYFGEDGVRSTRALYKCISYIVKHENVDMIMYCGKLKLNQSILIKPPKRFEPRTLHFTVDVLNKENEKRLPVLLDSKEWEYSLLNLDVR